MVIHVTPYSVLLSPLQSILLPTTPKAFFFYYLFKEFVIKRSEVLPVTQNWGSMQHMSGLTDKMWKIIFPLEFSFLFSVFTLSLCPVFSPVTFLLSFFHSSLPSFSSAKDDLYSFRGRAQGKQWNLGGGSMNINENFLSSFQRLGTTHTRAHTHTCTRTHARALLFLSSSLLFGALSSWLPYHSVLRVRSIWGKRTSRSHLKDDLASSLRPQTPHQHFSLLVPQPK